MVSINSNFPCFTTPNSEPSSLNTTMDMEFKDGILFQSYWMDLESAQGFNLCDQDHDPQLYLPLFGSNYEIMENFIEDVPLEYDEITSSLVLSQGFPYEDFDSGKSWWVGNSDLESQEEGSMDSISSTVKVSSPFGSCVDNSHWNPGMIMEADNEDEYDHFSRGFPKQEPEEDLKLTSYRGKNELLEVNHDQDFSDFVQNQKNFEVYHGFDGNGELCEKRIRSLGIRKPGEKRRTKPEKMISLQVLRQNFAQSLKDAAKILGVCPTTLKKICRQHGITRWPSRKIKKVNHSLRKLQRIVDSVEGAQGLIQIGSFYNNDSSLKLKDNTNEPKPEQENENPTKEKELITNTDQSLEWEEPIPIPASQSQCGGTLKVKASFAESNIRFSLQPHWNFNELQVEIAKRFGIACFSGIHLKYLDNDHESVLLTCDEDLEEFRDLFGSSQNQTIKMFLHQ